MGGRAGGRRRGVLGWLAGLLFASVLVRIGVHADMAVAVGTDPAPEEEVAAMPVEGAGPLLDALRAREARLAEREAALADRAQALNVAEAEIEEKLAALAAAEESLRAMIALAETAAETDLTQLTAVYENMKPQDAAALFETMDPAFSAGFLGRMQAAAAAAIMSNLSPDTAYSISAILAGRNAEVPTE